MTEISDIEQIILSVALAVSSASISVSTVSMQMAPYEISASTVEKSDVLLISSALTEKCVTCGLYCDFSHVHINNYLDKFSSANSSKFVDQIAHNCILNRTPRLLPCIAFVLKSSLTKITERGGTTRVLIMVSFLLQTISCACDKIGSAVDGYRQKLVYQILGVLGCMVVEGLKKANQTMRRSNLAHVIEMINETATEIAITAQRSRYFPLVSAVLLRAITEI